MYEAKCPKCGREYEFLITASEEYTKRCHDCRTKLQKQISKTSFILKGGGWAKDGYKGR